MTDHSALIERLEAYGPTNEWGDKVHHTICDEAAAALREAVEALRPFAAHAGHYAHKTDRAMIGGTVSNGFPRNTLTVGHCRRARAFILPSAPNQAKEAGE